MRKLIIKTVFILALLLALAGCRQQQEATSQPEGIVEANNAYLKHFGDPPPVQAGKAYARVLYLPLKNERSLVRAIPIYLFEEKGQLEKILGRMTDEKLALPPDSPLYVPIPEGGSLGVVSRQNGELRLALSVSEPVSSDLQPLAISLTETAGQFEDVTRVLIELNGKPLDFMPGDGFRPDAGHISEVGPPDLVMVVGIWEEGEPELHEVMVNFNRPVNVNALDLLHVDGPAVAGEYFTSVFRMAVVVRPESPGNFNESTRLRVVWDVTDALGRRARGEDVLAMQRYVRKEHVGEFQKK